MSSPAAAGSAVAAVVAALALICTPCAARGAASPAATVVAPLATSTVVRAYGSIAVWSADDEQTKRWQVMQRRHGTIRATAVPPSRSYIDVDLGPRPGGRPVLAYVRCGGCPLVVAALDGGTPTIVPHSAGAHSPSVWGRNVAWLRGRTTVVTSRWDGRGRRMLPGVPGRRCSAPAAGRTSCERPGNSEISEIELGPNHVALVDRFILSFGGGNSTNEVRIVPLSGRGSRLVATLATGEAGQSWLGLSWVKRRLYFYASCFELAETCARGFGGVYGFDPPSGAIVQAASPTVADSFAMDADGRSAYLVGPLGAGLHCGEVGDDPEAGPCLLQHAGPYVFARRGPFRRYP